MDSYTKSPSGVPIGSLPSQQAPRAASRLPLLLLLLLGVIVLAFLPALVERIEYARTRGEVRALREGLPELNLKTLAKGYTLIYRKVKPSVVHIDTRRQLRRRDDLTAALFGDRAPIVEEQTQASGVVVDASGYLVTNSHVVEGAAEITVNLDSGRSFAAEVVGADPALDLAVLKIDAAGLTPITWGDSDKLEVGEMVWAIGNPFGLDQTITAGIVSGKGRRGVGGSSVYQEFLQTDVAVNPGNSGGPLVDIDGDMVGINTAIVGRSFQGISFAIPSNLARETYEKIRATGKVVRGYLGIGLAPLTPALAAQLRLPVEQTEGAVVRGVESGSPAERAGIEAGDLILRWDTHPVVDPNELRLMIARAPVGSKVPVIVMRDGKELTLEVTVAERPPEPR